MKIRANNPVQIAVPPSAGGPPWGARRVFFERPPEPPRRGGDGIGGKASLGFCQGRSPARGQG